MAKQSTQSSMKEGTATVSDSIDELMQAALQRGPDVAETGRYLITFKRDAAEDGLLSLKALGLNVADARSYPDQAIRIEHLPDADAVYFPEIGVALIGGDIFEQHYANAQYQFDANSPIEAIEPEYFVYSDDLPGDYLLGFMSAVETIARDLGKREGFGPGRPETMPEVLGETWGLTACRVPESARSGAGIRAAVLDTGLDLGHPDFQGRTIVSQTFVGQPVQDLHSHGTHTTGTACGPKAPDGTTPRYGIAFRSEIYIGKVLSNSGFGSSASVLAGMNWAIANRCVVISMSLGSQSPVQAAYTAAGQAALNNGCLIIAAAGNAASSTGAPANSPTIMSVASLDRNLSPSSFSNFGKIEIAGPGRDVFSSVPRPTLYGIKSGTSMATPHVTGCAALWAESSTSLRGMALWSKLQTTAKILPFPPTRVGAGLVQAPVVGPCG